VDDQDDDEIIELTTHLTGKSIRALEDVSKMRDVPLVDALNLAIQVFAHLEVEIVVGGQELFLFTPGDKHLSQVRWHKPGAHPSG
jgi:hypothetical protein